MATKSLVFFYYILGCESYLILLETQLYPLVNVIITPSNTGAQSILANAFCHVGQAGSCWRLPFASKHAANASIYRMKSPVLDSFFPVNIQHLPIMSLPDRTHTAGPFFFLLSFFFSSLQSGFYISTPMANYYPPPTLNLVLFLSCHLTRTLCIFSLP